MSRQTTITDAAIATLATEGMRGLTHRAVDRAAALPEGSTSYYFRTRLALLKATVQRLTELDAAELPTVAARDIDTLVTATAALLHRWMTVDRHRQLARYELTLEATRRPELRDALVRSGARVRAMVADMLSAAGVSAADGTAHDLVALVDGLLFDQIAGAGDRKLTVADLGATVRRVVLAMVS